MKAIALFCLTLSFLGVAEANDKNSYNQTSGDNLATLPNRTGEARISQLNKGSQLIGIEVLNPQEERLGTIKDLMLSLHQKRIVYAVLGTGGFLGIRDKLMALPPNALDVSPGQKHLILRADKESLKAAPGFEKNNWPDMANVEWMAETDRHYAEQTGPRVTEAAGAEQKDARQKESGVASVTKDEEPVTAPATLPKNLRASELIGTTVRNLQREKLGNVRDVAVDLPSGKILYVVVSAGGLPGAGEKLFAIAPGNFQGSEETKTLVLDASRDTFARATGFSIDSWPATSDKAFSSSTDIRDPSGSPLPGEKDGRTALDQSNTRRDLMITQQLRRSIMRDDTMSLLTRNITIITADGRITVRGTVANQNEVEKIVAFAREIAGNEVTNELTVKDKGDTNETDAPRQKK
ncbi:MAG: PRC-barrel domain-containing protein [Verrucomicrobia bacterium]|nr:PRC-barrel domain-containing protein [Verrucomicrobiota bacterium]